MRKKRRRTRRRRKRRSSSGMVLRCLHHLGDLVLNVLSYPISLPLLVFSLHNYLLINPSSSHLRAWDASAEERALVSYSKRRFIIYNVPL